MRLFRDHDEPRRVTPESEVGRIVHLMVALQVEPSTKNRSMVGTLTAALGGVVVLSVLLSEIVSWEVTLVAGLGFLLANFGFVFAFGTLGAEVERLQAQVAHIEATQTGGLTPLSGSADVRELRH